MNQSQTVTDEGPRRGDTAEFTLGKGGNGSVVTGKITSTYCHGSEPRVSIVHDGKRFTRKADSVRVTRRAKEAPAVTRGPQRPGEPAPNRGRKYPAEILTTAEVGAILDQCSRRAPTGIRDRALLTLLYRSGLRISEVLDLRPSDVNMEAHTLRLLATKSGKAQTRSFYYLADDALSRWMDERRKLRIRGGRLFCNLKGGEMSEDAVRQKLRRLADRAGIEKRVHPHGLRHTFAFELVRARVTIDVISDLLGHSSVAVTAVYLRHLTNGDAADALQAASLPLLAGEKADRGHAADPVAELAGKLGLPADAVREALGQLAEAVSA